MIIKLTKAPEQVWFTSDLHFGHKNMAQWRGLESVDVMHTQLITNWRACVQPDDLVFVLGDVSFASVHETKTIFNQLPGTKYLVSGNHDAKYLNKPQFAELFDTVTPYIELCLNDQWYILFHYPIASWNGCYRGAIHLHGHIHSGLNNAFQLVPEVAGSKHYDVGVDNNGLSPINAAGVLNKFCP